MVGDEIKMNNTKTTTLAVAAIFIAATLVVGGTFAATSAFAYMKKGPQDNKKGTRDNGSDSRNGNTITVEKCKNKGSASGFDTTVNQECENLICTHPGNNATCVSEQEQAAVTPPVTPPINKECPAGTVFDVTTLEDSTNAQNVPAKSHICLTKPGENKDATIIVFGDGTITENVNINHAVNGDCPQGVKALVDTGNPPDGFSLGEVACTNIGQGGG